MDSDAYTCGTCKHGNLYDSCTKCEDEYEQKRAKKPQNDGGLMSLVMQCASAVIAGQKVVTISTTGKHPNGFPRGELLSVGTNGAHNYAVCPIKVLAWVHAKTSKTDNAPHNRQADGGTPLDCPS